MDPVDPDPDSDPEHYIQQCWQEMGTRDQCASKGTLLKAVLRIRLRIRMFLGMLDPDPFVRQTDPAPDPSIIFNNQAKTVRKTLIPTVL
jgi:hypothetical protein